MLQTSSNNRQLLPSEKKQVKDAMTKLMLLVLTVPKEVEKDYFDAMEKLHEMYPDVFGSH